MCSARVSDSFTVGALSQVPVEGAVKEGLFQFVQGGEFLLIDGLKVLGFSENFIEPCDELFQGSEWWDWHFKSMKHFTCEVLNACSTKVSLQLSGFVLSIKVIQKPTIVFRLLKPHTM